MYIRIGVVEYNLKPRYSFAVLYIAQQTSINKRDKFDSLLANKFCLLSSLA